MKRVGISSGLMPFRRGFGSGTRYAVSFPASLVCRSASLDGIMIMLLSEFVRHEAAGMISKPASRALADENEDPVVGDGSGLGGMLPLEDCERTWSGLGVIAGSFGISKLAGDRLGLCSANSDPLNLAGFRGGGSMVSNSDQSGGGATRS
jgi:hypothetical protein